MSALRKNVASQVLHFGLVNATTGAALTGATVSVNVSLDGTQSAGAGTVTELGSGQYKYVPTQGETNGTSVGFLFTATNAVPVHLQCFTTAADPTDAVRFGLTALPNAAAGAAGGLPLGDANGNVTPITADQGTAQAGASGTITLRSGASATDDLYKGAVVAIVSGTGAGQAREIAGYVGSTKVASVDRNWATAPNNTSVYRVFFVDWTTVKTQVIAAIVTDTYAEPSAPPAATRSLKDMVNWMCAVARNKLTSTATQGKTYADDGSTVIGTSALSDDGTTFTRGKVA